MFKNLLKKFDRQTYPFIDAFYYLFMVVVLVVAVVVYNVFFR